MLKVREGGEQEFVERAGLLALAQLHHGSRAEDAISRIGADHATACRHVT